MDALLLARLQFATTTSFHWLFVILTLGLAPLVAVMETWYVATGKPAHERMTRFWGQIYVINYVLGIVTGLVMEFQFGLNWSGVSRFVGNVFGAPLALETLVAFFAESTFLGMWIFGWHKLPKLVHVSLIWLVALTAYASAFWILVANGFLQHPVGFAERGGIGYLTDFRALLTNPNAVVALEHITAAAFLTGGFFLVGVSAYQFIRKTADREVFTNSLRLGLGVGAVAALFVIPVGFAQFPVLDQTQPMKLATIGGDAAQVATLQAQMAARYGPGDYSPPAWIGTGFEVMQNIAFLLFLVALVTAPLLFRNWLVRFRPLAYLMVALVPLPFIASIAGWLVREVGRQPWVVYGVLPTSDAVTNVSAGTMQASYIAFTALFVVLGIANWALIARFAGRNPDDVPLGAGPRQEAPEPVPATF